MGGWQKICYVPQALQLYSCLYFSMADFNFHHLARFDQRTQPLLIMSLGSNIVLGHKVACDIDHAQNLHFC